jgi:hypothetical protein
MSGFYDDERIARAMAARDRSEQRAAEDARWAPSESPVATITPNGARVPVSLSLAALEAIEEALTGTVADVRVRAEQAPMRESLRLYALARVYDRDLVAVAAALDVLVGAVPEVAS